MGKQEQVAKQVGGYLEKICKKNACNMGVWLTWEDLIRAVDYMRKNPQVGEIMYDLQIKFENGSNDQNKADDTIGS